MIKDIDPKVFTRKVILTGDSKKITEVLLHYFRYVNFYKKSTGDDIVKKAEELFGAKVV